ncbi:hypothetical protein [Halobacillus amylolyticus]|uniref:Uncharacterized protein n=1 Tax=Halobacillus amylolyticus TaxID=2932259 RepID=A0ABY4HDM3_9BACI|nr:hypothetical protein [Halobacillus amylolyticus]UOR12000.1 hypothetical protein MUO15_00185 [Halobacillus amylolyticus]
MLKHINKTFLFTVAFLFLLGTILGTLIVNIMLITSFSAETYLINSKNYDFVDWVMKSSLFLIGSICTGLVAFVLHFLKNAEESREVSEREKSRYEMVQNEFKENLKNISEVYEAFIDEDKDALVKLILSEDNEIKETVLISFTTLNFTAYNSHVDSLSDAKYDEQKLIWKKVKVVHQLMGLLNEYRNEYSIKKIINLMLEEINTVKDSSIVTNDN